jgi:hypothetical protein
MAELFVIGQIVGASGFSTNKLCCKYSLSFGSYWKMRKGEPMGQTQLDYSSVYFFFF